MVYLLRIGVDPDDPDEGGRYPLHYAVGDTDALNQILKYRVNIDVANSASEYTALMMASYGNDSSGSVELLLK